MDKSLLKISGIISIVIGLLCCLTIFGAIVGIPLVIGGVKFKDYSSLSDEELMTHKDAIIIWTIVFLFINQISGILGLVFVVTNNLFNVNQCNETNHTNFDNNKYESLEKLKKLYDDKILTKEEYEKEKDKILNGLN